VTCGVDQSSVYRSSGLVTSNVPLSGST
jgi:hypothetical protein